MNPTFSIPLHFHFNKANHFDNFTLIYSHYFYNVRKINCTIYGADSCEQLSDFSEHPEVPNKPHTLVCGKTQGLLDQLKLVIFKSNIIDNDLP